jgi:hypothetical protein
MPQSAATLAPIRGGRDDRTVEPQAPRYETGEDVRLGDRVIYDGTPGRVVFVIETRSFSPDYPAEYWDYLGKGVMLDTEAHGLVHLDPPGERVQFIGRADSK